MLKKIVRTLNTAWIILFNKGANLLDSQFLSFTISVNGTNRIDITGCTLEKGQLSISGENNSIRLFNMHVFETIIRIEGDGNELSVAENVKLRKANIIIRGSGCKIVIQKNTTFGSVRIVNTGTNNEIMIGENCLFADQIEIWASDTHPIFNGSGEIINPEKPVTIGNKVWVGSRVIILKGITINDNSIIGMGSVVTKDVPPGVVSAGHPNRTIKENVTWALHFPTPRNVKSHQ